LLPEGEINFSITKPLAAGMGKSFLMTS
jgi:hypothetical protein